MSTIEEIKNSGKFSWGIPVKWYEVGPYTLLAYHSWKANGYQILTGVPSDDLSYHGWIDGKDTMESWPSLECGLAGLMGEKYLGQNNGGVGYYFCKMIEAPPYDSAFRENEPSKARK